jgi:Protein of unknown function (DUF4232)
VKLTIRPGRRMTAAVALACGALVLPAVALASPSGARATAVPSCRNSTIYVWLALAPSGALGTTYYPIEFTNLGSRACTLRGFPGVSAITKLDRQLGPAAGRFQSAVRTITLKPNQSAHANLGIVTDGTIAGCHNATAFGLAVYPPNLTGKQFIQSFTFPACTNKVFMHVYPVQSGLGVP